MTPAPWARIVPIAEVPDDAALVTGLESVDDWFRTKARNAAQSSQTAVHCCVDDADQLVAFFALKMGIASVSGVSNALKRRAGANERGDAPSMLIAQMGVALELQGRGYGNLLLQEAFRVAVVLSASAPFGLIHLDAASDDLIGFYRDRGFVELDGERRLGITIARARKILAGLDSTTA